MSASFNVLDQGWIPVVLQDGTRQLLGIRQTLARAHELVEISDPSPLEEYSLYRFLGLFLMDALRPKKLSSIRTLLQKGKFDMETVEAYISQCTAEGVSFDLFDKERPFLQSKYDSSIDGDPKPVSVLDCTLPSGNNHTHFQHETQYKIQPSKATTLILTTYLFCTAAAQGYPSGPYGAPPFFGVIKGKCLFESLCAMLIPLDAIGIAFDEPPVLWRSKEPIQKKGQIGKTSWLRGLLFPTRRVTLIPDETTNLVSEVYLGQGENYVNKESWRDPYVTYRSNGTSVFPMRPHSESPIWRNYCDILDVPGNHASHMLCQQQILHPEDEACLTIYGVETDNASYLSVHRYDLALPFILCGQVYVSILKECISISQQLLGSLRLSLRLIPSLPADNVEVAVNMYDKSCEESFWKLSRVLAENTPVTEKLYSQYCNDIAQAAIRAFDVTMLSLRLKARAMAEVETARSKLVFATRKMTRR